MKEVIGDASSVVGKPVKQIVSQRADMLPDLEMV
jgi:hypothetical protein